MFGTFCVCVFGTLFVCVFWYFLSAFFQLCCFLRLIGRLIGGEAALVLYLYVCVVGTFCVFFLVLFGCFFPALSLLPPINWRANWRRGRTGGGGGRASLPTVSILKQSPFKISFRLFTNTPTCE